MFVVEIQRLDMRLNVLIVVNVMVYALIIFHGDIGIGNVKVVLIFVDLDMYFFFIFLERALKS